MWHWAMRYFWARALQKIGAKCHELLQPKDKSWKSVKIQRQASSTSGFFFQLCPDHSIAARDKVSVVEFTIYLLSKTEDCLFCHLEKYCKTLQTLIAGISQQHCSQPPISSLILLRVSEAHMGGSSTATAKLHGSAHWGLTGILVGKWENRNSDLMR